MCDSVHYGVEISRFVCDAPARSFIKNVKSHTGYNVCNKCTQEGVYVRNRMAFPETNAPLLHSFVSFTCGFSNTLWV
jgi:hypothetical protein